MNKVKAERKGDSTIISNVQGTSADLSTFDPSDLMAASLAKCTSDTVTRMIEKEAMSVVGIGVRVDLAKDGVAKRAEFVVHVDIEGDITDEELAAIDKAARTSYIRRLLALDMHVHGHTHYNDKGN